MIKKYIVNKRPDNSFLIRAIFKEDKASIIEKENYIFDDPISNSSYVYLGTKKDLSLDKISKIFKQIISNKNRDYSIDSKTFVTKNISEDEVIKLFIYSWYEIKGKTFSLKTSDEKFKDTFLLLEKELKKDFDEHILIASQICEIRSLQNMPPNILGINKFISYIKNLSTKNKSLSLKILTKKDLKKLKMNLILGVNEGSSEDVKVAVLEYKPNSSKSKITFVGKGIMFDSGGYNLKTPGRYMLDMKYDMSGAAISVLIVDTIAKLGIKQNVSCVVPLTDNMVDSLAQTPESILESMSGKTVEVANTDAEGRLILADAITYAAKELKSSLIIDLSTLTGTVIYALGKYTGAWSTCDKNWKLLEKSSQKSNENVWRMPLDNIYLEGLDKGTFADTLSCSNTNKPDSNIAAAWLNQFACGVEYIHLDIAGSADQNSKGQSPMFKTLIEFVKSY